MTLLPGSRLGPYEIVAPIGAPGRRDIELHVDPNLEPLNGYSPFDQLMAPRS
jgi:hypothetical protein